LSSTSSVHMDKVSTVNKDSSTVYLPTMILMSVLCLLKKSAKRGVVKTLCEVTSATVNKAFTMTATFLSAL
ncbi:hypothetical protein ILYODFUR_012288, partial [Ilyodon furcidens]